MKHIIPISGKDSLATALVMMRDEPREYEFIFNDIGSELPETYAWLEKVEQALGITIERFGKDLKAMIRKKKILPSGQKRFCTSDCKIKPTENHIGNEDAILHLGLRYDEPYRVGFVSKNENAEVRYPLKEKKMILSDVYEIISAEGLKPPTFFWLEIYERVCSMLGEQKNRLDNLSEWQFDRLFAWRTRTNCYHCFFQRRYEWVGLLEHHPELFAEAQEVEAIAAGDKREKAFYFIGQGYPLSLIKNNAEKIKSKLVNDIVLTVIPERKAGRGTKAQKASNRTIFEDNWQEETVEVDAIRSCGFFCGK